MNTKQTKYYFLLLSNITLVLYCYLIDLLLVYYDFYFCGFLVCVCESSENFLLFLIKFACLFLSKEKYLVLGRRKWGGVGFSSVCCEYILLTLINKEAALAYGSAESS